MAMKRYKRLFESEDMVIKDEPKENKLEKELKQKTQDAAIENPMVEEDEMVKPEEEVIDDVEDFDFSSLEDDEETFDFEDEEITEEEEEKEEFPINDFYEEEDEDEEFPIDLNNEEMDK